MPPKVSCFCWVALYEACLTQNNLSKRKIQIVNICYMYLKHSESVKHLFLHCTVGAAVWNMFFAIFGLTWVMPNTIKDAYVSWCQWRVGKSIKKIWSMVPASIFWCLWNERNRRCFDGIATPVHILKAKCLMYLFSWLNQAPISSCEQFLDGVCSLVLE